MLSLPLGSVFLGFARPLKAAWVYRIDTLQTRFCSANECAQIYPTKSDTDFSSNQSQDLGYGPGHPLVFFPIAGGSSFWVPSKIPQQIGTWAQHVKIETRKNRFYWLVVYLPLEKYESPMG